MPGRHRDEQTDPSNKSGHGSGYEKETKHSSRGWGRGSRVRELSQAGRVSQSGPGGHQRVPKLSQTEPNVSRGHQILLDLR